MARNRPLVMRAAALLVKSGGGLLLSSLLPLAIYSQIVSAVVNGFQDTILILALVSMVGERGPSEPANRLSLGACFR